MEYRKPEVVRLGSAFAAVQMQTGKHFSGNPDQAAAQPKYTLPAYEADE